MENKNSIKLEHISKRFGEQEVLKDISYEFESGKVYGIIGKNGAGKSVLFKCICGLCFPTSGEIYIGGENIVKNPNFTKKIGAVIENPGFLPNYNAIHNLEFLYTINHKKNRKVIEDVIEMVGLAYAKKKKVGKYSLGMKQRLAIAQAIMEDPDIFIFDEPMNGLDINGVEDVRNLIIDLKKKGKTILMSSHDERDIELLCDLTYQLNVLSVSSL
jgi:ABC-2 type transport system ATP-binding protein